KERKIEKRDREREKRERETGNKSVYGFSWKNTLVLDCIAVPSSVMNGVVLTSVFAVLSSRSLSLSLSLSFLSPSLSLSRSFSSSPACACQSFFFFEALPFNFARFFFYCLFVGFRILFIQRSFECSPSLSLSLCPP